MTHPLRILHLEDLPEDADFVSRALKKAGIEFEILHAEDKNEFIKALQEFSPDVILSDHSLPSFDSREALKIVKEMGLAIPFILVTATVSEEYAVSIIREGASDYILKDRLQRLPNAISGALEKYKLEQARNEANETLRISERKYKLLFESNPMPMWMVSKSTLDIIAVNKSAINHYGYTREEFLKLNARDLRPEEDIEKYVEAARRENSGMQRSGVWRHKKKDGSIIMVDIIADDLVYENNPVRLVLANDITEKLRAEAEVNEQRERQQKLLTKISIQAQERERDEIGKELHDNINQILAAGKLYMDISLAKNGKDLEIMKKSHEHIVLAIEEIRKLSHSLVAPSLGNITLIEAIEALFANIRLATSLKLELVNHNYNEEGIDKNINLMFYRIIQEQINNVIKHAGAKNVTVQLSANPDTVGLIIEDNGVGFDNGTVSKGIGLRNISTRIGIYDGAMQIIAAPGKGCKLDIAIPMRRAVAAQ